MKQAKHVITAESSSKRYATPRAKVLFIKAQDVLCVSPAPPTETDPEEDILP